MQGDILTPIEIAKALRVSTDAVYMELNNGKFSPKRVGRQSLESLQPRVIFQNVQK